ncbi:DUF3696 domain-containing protein [Chromobacterium phragmitis]|uniref:DUF3696 domain-containing protein n=1 Tax=Chromobacterium phragmitis TaxID=2202141 RepID=A0ABV0ISJ3_9NEIS
MLTHLKLENFKIWRSTGPIRLAPITLLLGTNSSGKSSLIQSLLLIRQTARCTDLVVDLYFGRQENNDSVVLGQFQDVLCRHGASNEVMSAKKIGIEFSWSPEWGQPSSVFTARYRSGFAEAAEIEYLRLGPDGEGFTVSRVRSFMYKLQIATERKSRGANRFFRPDRSFFLPPQAVDQLGGEGIRLKNICNTLEHELQKIIYLGPIRRSAQRDYFCYGRMPTEIKDDGALAIEALITSAVVSGELNGRHSTNPDSLWNATIFWLRQMKLATGLKVKRLGKSDRYELLVLNGDSVSNLKDVGVGVSQVLPVIVATLFARRGHILIIEEPETHLHPLAQSELANLFSYASQMRGVQFVVETHSEHIFRRMQTLVAKQSLPLSFTAMYFVEREGRDARIKSLEVDDLGRVRNWPEGFFGDVLGETREQTALAIKRARELRAQDGNVSS